MKKFETPIVAHIPGVGQNLQYHMKNDIQYRCKKPVTLYSAQSPYNAGKIGLQWLLFKPDLEQQQAVKSVDSLEAVHVLNIHQTSKSFCFLLWSMIMDVS